MAKKFSSGSFKASSSQQTVASDKKDDVPVSKSKLVKNNSVETSGKSDKPEVKTSNFVSKRKSASFGGDKSEQSNQSKTEQIFTLIGLFVFIVSFIIGGIMVYNSISGLSETEDYIAELQGKSGELETILNKAMADESKRKKEQEETIKSKSNSASTEGITIANAQTRLGEAVMEPDSLGSKEKSDFETLLYRYFGNKVFANPWFVGDSSNWYFCSTYQYPNKKIPVLWICAESKTSYDGIKAYMRGVYDVDRNMFSDCVYHMTSYGDTTRYVESSSDSLMDDDIDIIGVHVTDKPKPNVEKVKPKKKKKHKSKCPV